MYGTLAEETMEQMLHSHRYGRLGFTLDGEVSIIPINYAYDGAHIYAHATPGAKAEGMRHNPAVAFEIDEVEDPAHWRSVLLHGRAIELHDRAAKEAAFTRILAQGGGERSQVTFAMGLDELLVFRIDITARTGRFEQRQGITLGQERTPLTGSLDSGLAHFSSARS